MLALTCPGAVDCGSSVLSLDLKVSKYYIDNRHGRCQLRSANSRTCVVRRTCSSYGDRCFAAAGPRLWNSLPAHLRQTDINFEQFKWQLKTFLFGR